MLLRISNETDFAVRFFVRDEEQFETQFLNAMAAGKNKFKYRAALHIHFRSTNWIPVVHVKNLSISELYSAAVSADYKWGQMDIFLTEGITKIIGEATK